MKELILASGGVRARELRATEVVAADSADSQIPTEVIVGRGAAVSAEDRAKLNALILAARAGKIARLKLANVAFTSDDPDNSNSFEFPPEEFAEFAASFSDQPFQRDHSDRHADRGGTVLRAWAEAPDQAGRRWARADIELTEPWAIAGALNGTIDRFSFGAKVTEQLCSVCGKDFFACKDHALGKTYDGKKARVLCKGVRGDEISAVVKPAYSGTGIGAIEVSASGQVRSLDIAAMRGDTEKEIHSMDQKELAKLCGLAETATEEEIKDAITKRFAVPVAEESATVPASIVHMLDLPATASAAEVNAAIMERTYRPDSDEDKKALAQVKAQRRFDFWAKEQRKFSPAEQEWALNYAMKDPEAFEIYASKKAPVIPSPTPPTAITAAVAETTSHDESLTADEEMFLQRNPKLTKDRFIAERKEYRELMAARGR